MLKGVTSNGPSAGAISVGLQMVTNGGNNEGLFRAGIMHAGGTLPTGDIELQQPFYDMVVAHANCTGAVDTLECLRQVPADTLRHAGEAVPNIFDYPVSTHLSSEARQNVSRPMHCAMFVRGLLRPGRRTPTASSSKHLRNTSSWREAWRTSHSSPVSDFGGSEDQH